MTVIAKICGLADAAALDAALAHGARFVGFVFYPRSPRAVTPAQAAALAARAGRRAIRVGLFVDPDDAQLDATLAAVPLDLLQLHGVEPPDRVAALARRRPAMKALSIAAPADLARAKGYEAAADWLLFDAKPPPERADALPGGNGLAFDWRLIAGQAWRRPWMLSGGLTPDNLAEAVAVSGARAVDVSSGVEVAPGRKDPGAIARFLDAAGRL
ncbi:MAG: phosphoribosylanthranilate isomerase [Alphaproteobacteria bacterium]|nr:phosphoribosylanthranilate isomerase [Alphaproteobacteria bacterium]